MVRFLILAGLLALAAGCKDSEGEQAQLNHLESEVSSVEDRLFGSRVQDGEAVTLENLYARQVAIEAYLQGKETESRWPVKIPAKLNGETIDICVYPEPLSDGGFVVNVHTEADKQRRDGVCWGTVIYPGKAVEQRPITD